MAIAPPPGLPPVFSVGGHWRRDAPRQAGHFFLPFFAFLPFFSFPFFFFLSLLDELEDEELGSLSAPSLFLFTFLMPMTLLSRTPHRDTTIGAIGLSSDSVFTPSMASRVASPSTISPNTTCFPFRWCAGLKRMKN